MGSYMHNCISLLQTMGAKQFSMLGWSDGGITAMIVAGRYPNLVRKLVVWGANSYVTKEEIDVYNSIRDIDTWSKRMKQPMIELYGEEYFREQWGKWIDAISRYYTERGGMVYHSNLACSLQAAGMLLWEAVFRCVLCVCVCVCVCMLEST